MNPIGDWGAWQGSSEWVRWLAIPGVQGPPYDWGWGTHPMMWGTWGFGMMLMMLVFWALLIVAVVLGIRWAMGQGKEARPDAALETLRQRYARGEINKEEFESKKRDLS